MSKFAKLKNSLSFAHLAGVSRSKAGRIEDDEDDNKAEEDREEEKAKATGRAEDDSDDNDRENKAESDDDEKSASTDDGDDDDSNKEKSSKKAKATDDEDDDKDEEMRGNSATAAARRREQARCAAIFASPAAGKNPALAANLAFKTRMSRTEALAVLEETPAPNGARSHSARSDNNPNLGRSTAPKNQNSQQNIQSGWDRAFAKANPRKAG